MVVVECAKPALRCPAGNILDCSISKRLAGRLTEFRAREALRLLVGDRR
jgi:hypothetical protein